MADLVDRLREGPRAETDDGWRSYYPIHATDALLEEAADEIERLRHLLERARQAMRAEFGPGGPSRSTGLGHVYVEMESNLAPSPTPHQGED